MAEDAANDAVSQTDQGGNAMSTIGSDEPKLIFPGLAGFYLSVSDLGIR
jgi:hypothetical protein